MIRVDPASPEFEHLPKQEQARIYYFDIGWSVAAIAEELDEGRKTVGEWLDGVVRLPRQDLKRPRPRHVGPEFDKLFALYAAGKRPVEIIKLVKLHRSTVYEAIAEKFGSLRHQGEAA